MRWRVGDNETLLIRNILHLALLSLPPPTVLPPVDMMHPSAEPHWKLSSSRDFWSQAVVFVDVGVRRWWRCAASSCAHLCARVAPQAAQLLQSVLCSSQERRFALACGRCINTTFIVWCTVVAIVCTALQGEAWKLQSAKKDFPRVSKGRANQIPPRSVAERLKRKGFSYALRTWCRD